ncbi:MAG: hypothetical protein IBJ03_04365 [Gemmatimonadaceae bacterium]|nr:hypothetical protein [Gemmatimonadaceae bacterium]
MPKDRVETAQLQREIAGVVVHDLGSIAGALAMRAELPAPVDVAAYERQQTAMRELARQLRGAMQLLELARVEASSRLATPAAVPSARVAPPVPLHVWIEQLQGLARAILPRRGTFVVHASDDGVRATGDLPDAAVLTQLIQAAWHGVVIPNDAAVSPTIELTLAPRLSMTAIVPSRSPLAGTQKWRRFSERLAAECGYQVRWWEAVEPHEEERVALRWSCEPVVGAPA